MKRRTLLLGLGTTAAGSAVLFGSGAFTQVSADRGVTIGIDRDSEALLALIANDDFDSVFENDDGELEIDTDEIASDGEGFNVGATIEIGETEEGDDGVEVVEDEEAFKIVNNFDSNINVTIDLTHEDLDGSGELTFHTTRSDSEVNESVTADEDNGELTLETVESGAEVLVAIEIETDSTDDPEDFDGEVTFRADPSAQEAPPEPGGSISIGEDTYDTLDEALDAADESDTIVLGPSNSNYTISESIPNDVTIEGPNTGVPGDGDRGSEATIEGDGIDIDGDGVILSGVEVQSDEGGSDVLKISGDNATVEYSIVKVTEDNQGAIDDSGGDTFTLDSSVVEFEAEDAPTSLVNIAQNGATIANSVVDDQIRVNADADFTAEGNQLDNINHNADDSEILDNEFVDGLNAGVTHDADNVTIEGNTFSGNQFGIFLRGDNNEVRDNTFENLTGEREAAGEESQVVGVAYLSGSDNEIEDNEFQGNEFHLSDAVGDIDVADLLEDNEFDLAAGVDDVDGDNEQIIVPEIGEAVDAAATDATVTVTPGTYEEDLVVDVEGLTLEGPNAEIPGDDNREDEATIESIEIGDKAGSGAPANGATFAGFEISGDGDGTAIGSNSDDITVKNNIVDNFRTGFTSGLASSDTDELTAELTNNKFSGHVSAISTEGAYNVTITENTFAENRNGIGFNADDTTGDITIEDNSFEIEDVDALEDEFDNEARYVSVRGELEGEKADDVKEDNDFDPDAVFADETNESNIVPEGSGEIE